MAIPAKGIPRSLFSKAQAIAIVPGVVQGAFVIGIRKGHGVLVSRDDQGNWRVPQFIELTGGSVGWQAGVQSTDVILVFRSRESVANLMRGKMTIGVDAAAAAGPVGRQAAAATDLPLKSEIYSYSRSRGAFLGVSLDGTVLKPDPQADARFYQSPPTGQPGIVPVSAVALVTQIAQYSGGGANPTVASFPQSAAVPAHHGQPDGATSASTPPSAIEAQLRAQLTTEHERLRPLLDVHWQQYLAIPPPADADLVAHRNALAHYEAVLNDPAYNALTSRREFQTVMTLLKQLVAVKSQEATGPLSLPSPPTLRSSSVDEPRTR